jgi:hypothetical protein
VFSGKTLRIHIPYQRYPAGGWLIKFSMSVTRFSCVSLTRIGIRRAALEYNFENLTILDKKKNGKADKIHFAILKKALLLNTLH